MLISKMTSKQKTIRKLVRAIDDEIDDTNFIVVKSAQTLARHTLRQIRTQLKRIHRLPIMYEHDIRRMVMTFTLPTKSTNVSIAVKAIEIALRNIGNKRSCFSFATRWRHSVVGWFISFDIRVII